MSIDMIMLGKYCIGKNHANRETYQIGNEKTEICHDCIKLILEGIKQDMGWYNPYDE